MHPNGVMWLMLGKGAQQSNVFLTSYRPVYEQTWGVAVGGALCIGPQVVRWRHPFFPWNVPLKSEHQVVKWVGATLY